MPLPIIILSLSLVASVSMLMIMIIKERKSYAEHQLIDSKLQDVIHQKELLQEQLEITEQKEILLRERLDRLMVEEATHKNSVENLRAENAKLHQKIEQIQLDMQQVTEHRYEAEQHVKLMQQKLKDMQFRMEDFEKMRAENIQSAKEAMFETGSATFRKEAESMTEKTMQHMQNVLKQVAHLQEKVQENGQSVSLLEQVLKTPGGAGHMAEIGLENTLKSYALEPERDFKTQFSVSDQSGNNLRPDAVVFLPNNQLLVIDCKASKHFMELAELQQQDQEKEQALLQKLKIRMHEHLKSLTGKGYKEAVKKSLGREHQQAIRHTTTVLFVHTEAAIDNILRADPTFHQQAQEKGVIVSGPTGLYGLLSVSKMMIAQEQQDQNQQKIIEEVSALLGNIETTLSHSIKVGNSIAAAAKHFQNLTKSVNGRLLPKARKIHDMGVGLPKNKKIPAPLKSLHIYEDSNPVIETQANYEADSTDDARSSEPLLYKEEA